LRGSDPSAAQSDPIAVHARIPAILPQTYLHWGCVMAALLAVACWIVLKWGTAGFELRAAGLNPTAARWSGIRVERVTFNVMCVSGALGGLAGGIQIAAVNHVLNIQASEEFGYMGIAVGLLGRLNPLGVLAAAVGLGMLEVGGLHAERQPTLAVPAELSEMIMGLLMLTVLVVSGPRITTFLQERAWKTKPQISADERR
jgi:simple sugar transport system permease protein